MSESISHTEKDLLYKVAWYYYMEGQTQQAIAELLNITRIRVIRLLERARQLGIVQIQVCSASDEFLSLENHLMKKYGLQDCYIIPAASNIEEAKDTLAKAAAVYVQNHISDNAYINFGFGDTTTRIINYLAQNVSSSVSFVSLTGGITNYLPNIGNTKLYLYPAPLSVSSAALSAAIQNEPVFKQITEMSLLANMTIVGIGGMNTDSTICKSPYLSDNDFLLLKMQGAVGDIISHFIDTEGNLVNPDFDARFLSTPLSLLRELNNVIGVALGDEKLEAIRAALHGNYLNILITDESTAKSL